ncbi:hypothetical protein N8I77_006702 [Diaporthe amygdali]|uniref:Gluconokinase n=1 Tax=Phomopsis amygdali TaxID=1214568 RepID=A0AAD9SH66_PHOAM|nr:hypothetical protein N8I77_006702 [Diaporthe amygdali]
MTEKPTTERPRYVFFFTGATACGKSTIAKHVADNLDLTFLEGDDFHPKANVEKMHHGEALTDEDRQGWLEALRDHENMHPPGETSLHLVMTCSALKRHYRDILRKGSEQAQNLRIRFIFLDAPEEVLTKRAAERKGHFAGSNLVHSQFDSLERPAQDEGDVFTINVDRPLEEIKKDALEHVRHVLAA